MALLYASKHQTTEQTAQNIAVQLQPYATIKLMDVRKDKTHISLAEYDVIVLGTPIYAGKPYVDFSRIASLNDFSLLNKNIFLFAVGMEPNPQKQQDELSSAFPVSLTVLAKGKYFLGGAFDFQKMNFLEKWIIKKIAKISQSISLISQDRVELLVNDIRKVLK